LITFTFFSPAAARTTSNSSFSAAASPPASPPAAGAATATAAAADTPNFSYIAWTSSTTSITLISAMAFNKSSLDNAIFFS